MLNQTIKHVSVKFPKRLTYENLTDTRDQIDFTSPTKYSKIPFKHTESLHLKGEGKFVI